MFYHPEDRKFVEEEFTRMGFDKDDQWRLSEVNKDFELCNTYPRFLIVPSSFKDEDLEAVAKFRYFRRIPVAVWRHIDNGCFIVRSSQPTVGWFGWFRNEMDESLVISYASIDVSQDNGKNPPENDISPTKESSNSTENDTPATTTKMLIIDARSYAASMANRAKGGGCECAEYYQNCEVQFMNLANIHSIRRSFQSIRSVCEAYSEQSNK